MIVLYEKVDKLALIADMWKPEAIYLNSKAGTLYENDGVRVPYISTKEFESLKSDIVVIIGCESQSNIAKAIKKCDEFGYKYKMIDDVIFRNYSISFKEIREKYHCNYKDNFGNTIIVDPDCILNGSVAFNNDKYNKNCISRNTILIKKIFDSRSVFIELKSDNNVINFAEEINIQV